MDEGFSQMNDLSYTYSFNTLEIVGGGGELDPPPYHPEILGGQPN